MNGEEEKSPLSNGGSVHSESKYNRIHLTPVNNDGEQGSGQKNDAKAISEIQGKLSPDSSFVSLSPNKLKPTNGEDSGVGLNTQEQNERLLPQKIDLEKSLPDPFSVSRPPNWYWEDDKPLQELSSPISLRVLVVTWNLHGKKGPNDLSQLLNLKAKHHLIAVCTQECWRSIGASLFNQDKSKWEAILINQLKDAHVLIKSHTIGAMHIAVFAHHTIFGLIGNVESADVATGIGNLFGNKGGCGVSFTVGGRSFLFVNSHLASGQNKVRRRNSDWFRIEKEMRLPSISKATAKASSYGLLTDRFEVVFWCGDLNYRVNGTRDEIFQLLHQKKHKILLENDQLTLERVGNKTAGGFLEAPIFFAPSYKFVANTNNWDNSKKQRIPAWTDRILYKSKSSCTIKYQSYDSNNNVKMSDHRPVFGQYEIDLNIELNKAEKLVPVKRSAACQIF